ncbi:unnamed protein product [Prorocentrum cordatum]|uniref:Uncharacterized protein n=1 Tax=Prorocentrum cordatum TaxID=2364126 RepID=A0ABN9VTM5_9DINO|nr:unnamed protein product [Polarella glacialis]
MCWATATRHAAMNPPWRSRWFREWTEHPSRRTSPSSSRATASGRGTRIPDDASKTYPLQRGVHVWKQYAEYHGYSIYSGMPENADVDCPGLEERHGAWTKPCMAMQLIKKHKYLIIVDRDTTVLKPRLRLEPLFRMAGLMEKNPQRVMAVAQESGAPAAGASAPRRAATSTPVSCSSGPASTAGPCVDAAATPPSRGGKGTHWSLKAPVRR